MTPPPKTTDPTSYAGPFAPVDPAAVRPSVDDVALLERSRTVSWVTGEDVGAFTSETRPSSTEVGRLIDEAMDTVLGRLPATLDPALYPAIRRQVAVRTAVMIEFSFFREQFAQGSAQQLLKILEEDAALLATRAGSGPLIY